MSRYSLSVSDVAACFRVVAYHSSHSVPCGHRHRVLLLPIEGYPGAGRDLPCPLYPEFRVHLPSAGVRLHLRAECRLLFYFTISGS